MRKTGTFWVMILAGAPIAGAQPIRINEIQVIGSHNSYHAGLGRNEMAYLRKTNPKAAEALDYSHPPLTDQLNAGVRQLEIDVFGDAKGGLFAKPATVGLMAKAGFEVDPPFDPEGLMMKPGFKVLHAQDVDYRSRCQPFVACLAEIRAWSKTHPKHIPIFILIENKDGRSRPYMVAPEPLTAETFNLLDAEIRTVFRPGEMITPDDVRGSSATLETAVLGKGWPLLEESRGKVMFVLDQDRVGPLYTKGHPALEGRVMFTNSTAGQPDAAFMKLNDPLSEQVQAAVRKGYIVRTMSDPGPAGVRAGETRRRDAALASGAQMVSTDYPFDEKAPESGYSVKFEHGDGPFNIRCNPVLKAAGCTADLLRE